MFSSYNNQTNELISAFGAALSTAEVPSLPQLALLFSVIFFLFIDFLSTLFIFLSKQSLTSPFFNSTVHLLIKTSEPAMGKFKQFTDNVHLFSQFNYYVDKFFYWTGLSKGCVEALVCRAGASMSSDWPQLSSKISSLFDSTSDRAGHYTKMLLDAMAGRGSCSVTGNFNCPAITRSQTFVEEDHHATSVAQVFARSLFNETVSKIALLFSSIVVTMLAAYTGGLLLIILNRKQKKSPHGVNKCF